MADLAISGPKANPGLGTSTSGLLMQKKYKGPHQNMIPFITLCQMKTERTESKGTAHYHYSSCLGFIIHSLCGVDICALCLSIAHRL